MAAMLPDFVEKTMNNFLKGMAFCLLGVAALQTAHASALDVEIVSRADGRVLPGAASAEQINAWLSRSTTSADGSAQSNSAAQASGKAP